MNTTAKGRCFKTTNYVRGRAFEYRVKKHYEREGWLMLRTAQSRGPVDLVGLNPMQVLFVQCKNRKPTRRELKEFNDFREMYNQHGAVRMYLVYPRGRRLMEI